MTFWQLWSFVVLFLGFIGVWVLWVAACTFADWANRKGHRSKTWRNKS